MGTCLLYSTLAVYTVLGPRQGATGICRDPTHICPSPALKCRLIVPLGDKPSGDLLCSRRIFGEQTHMSLGQNISRAILQWPVSGLVNHKEPAGKSHHRAQSWIRQTHRLCPEDQLDHRPDDPATVLRDLGLPGPFTPLELNGQLLPRYVCLDRPPPLFGTRNKPLPSCRSSTSCWTCTSRIRRWTSR